jgi:hypothetical protein
MPMRGGPYDEAPVLATWAFFTGLQTGDVADGAAGVAVLVPSIGRGRDPAGRENHG